MLQQIIAFALMKKEYTEYFIKSLGIGNNGFTIRAFIEILANQLKYDHPISIIIRVCEVLSYIQKPGKYLSEDNSNIVVFIFRELMQEALQVI